MFVLVGFPGVAEYVLPLLLAKVWTALELGQYVHEEVVGRVGKFGALESDFCKVVHSFACVALVDEVSALDQQELIEELENVR